jgi:hypothetical protein
MEHRIADRIAGGAMIGAAALSVLAMAHHPTHIDGNGGLNGFIHATMIVLVTTTFFGFAHFALRRGVARPAVLAGLIAYAISLFAHIGAATINGFVVPALASRGVTDHGLYLFAWEANQALAGLGVYATAAAYSLWALDCLRRPGLEPKALGALGLVAGLVPASLLGAGAIRMDVAGAILAYALFSAWAVLVGAHIYRGRLDEPGADPS